MNSEYHFQVEKLRQFYDCYRKARLNQLYYGLQLSRTRRINFWLEVLLAVGSSSSPVAAWAVWKAGAGQYCWLVFAGVVGILATLKPLLRLSSNLERYTQLWAAHSDLFLEFQQFVYDIRARQALTPEIMTWLDSSCARYRKLALQDDVVPDEEFRGACFEIVNVEIPVSQLWLPSQPEETKSAGVGA